MADRDYRALTAAQWDAGRFLSVGLDSEFGKLPEAFQAMGPRHGIVAFNRTIVDATRDIAGSYKPNCAFYEAHGADGVAALEESVRYIRDTAPELPIILDAKRADIGNTNLGYAAFAFDYLQVDAMTVHPYLGREALQPLLDRVDKGIIVLCRTSNQGSGEFQDALSGSEPLYKTVARHVSQEWNTGGNCSLVVGATYPEEIAEVRAIAPDLPFLIPGVGAQGGDLEQSVRAARDQQGRGFVVAISRAVLFASAGANFAEAAREEALRFHAAIKNAL